MKISVITPSYNSALFLKDAIESVLIQNYPNFEHIVIDAASTDNTLEILKSYKHLRWISEPDKGQSDALNKGINMATGDVIVILNADDYFLPHAFQTIIPYFRNGATFVVGDVCIVDDTQKKKIVHPKIQLKEMLYHWEGWKNLYENHYISNFPNNPVQYFYRRSIHDTVLFNIDNHLTMDLEFLLEAATSIKFTKIDATLGVYRFFEETKTGQSIKNAESYWSIENFFYVDKFLLNLSKKEIVKFKNEQFKGYSNRIYTNPKLLSTVLNQLKLLEKLPISRYPFKKTLGFKKLLSLYREYIK